MKPERLARKIVYESDWVNLYLDRVHFPSGEVIDPFHLLDFSRSAVTALAENEQGELLFVRVSRYTTGLAEWELPAGGVEHGEAILDAARRELLEETGHASTDHRLLHSFYPMPGNANKLFHVVHCRAGELVQAFDANEISDVRWFNRAEIEQMIADGTSHDGLTLVALLFWLSGAGTRAAAASRT